MRCVFRAGLRYTQDDKTRRHEHQLRRRDRRESRSRDWSEASWDVSANYQLS